MAGCELNQSQRVGVGWGAKVYEQGREKSQSPWVGEWQITELISWDCGRGTKLNYTIFLGEELASQICDCRVTQLQPGKKCNVSDHLGQTGSEQSQNLIALRAKGRNYCSEASFLMRTLQSSCLHQPDHQTKDNRNKNLPADSLLSCLTGRATHLSTQPRKSVLRTDRDSEKPWETPSHKPQYLGVLPKLRTFAALILHFLFLCFFSLLHFSFLFLFFYFIFSYFLPFLLSVFNFITTIFLCLFLLPSLSFLFLFYNPLFSSAN